MTASFAQRLEQYALAHPQEVLLVHCDIEGEPDQVMIFKGVSSSLFRPTAFDPDVPVLPAAATIESIDRFVAPYNPAAPQAIATDLTRADMEALLAAAGL